jgi:hypothetical protein
MPPDESVHWPYSLDTVHAPSSSSRSAISLRSNVTCATSPGAKVAGIGVSGQPESTGGQSTSVLVPRSSSVNDVTQPDYTRIVFRVGLHLGDLIVDGDDLYGDGVNIAARLLATQPIPRVP